MWLELHFELNPDNDNKFVFGDKGKSDPDSIKSSNTYHLQQIMKSEDFTLDFANNIDDNQESSSHSTRKFGINLGHGGGKSRNNVNHHDRWKDHNQH